MHDWTPSTISFYIHERLYLYRIIYRTVETTLPYNQWALHLVLRWRSCTVAPRALNTVLWRLQPHISHVLDVISPRALRSSRFMDLFMIIFFPLEARCEFPSWYKNEDKTFLESVFQLWISLEVCLQRMWSSLSICYFPSFVFTLLQLLLFFFDLKVLSPSLAEGGSPRDPRAPPSYGNFRRRRCSV